MPWTWDTNHFTLDDNANHTMDGWHKHFFDLIDSLSLSSEGGTLSAISSELADILNISILSDILYMAAKLYRKDDIDVSIEDITTLFSALSRVDNLGISIDHITRLASVILTSDSIGVNLSSAVQILSRMILHDSLNVNLSEFVGMFKEINLEDDLSIDWSDAYALTVIFGASDNLAVATSEIFSLLSRTDVTDALGINVADLADLYLFTLPTKGTFWIFDKSSHEWLFINEESIWLGDSQQVALWGQIGHRLDLWVSSVLKSHWEPSARELELWAQVGSHVTQWLFENSIDNWPFPEELSHWVAVKTKLNAWKPSNKDTATLWKHLREKYKW